MIFEFKLKPLNKSRIKVVYLYKHFFYLFKVEVNSILKVLCLIVLLYLLSIHNGYYVYLL